MQLALATLVLIEEYLPLPFLKARILIQNASTQSDRKYAELDKTIKSVEQKVRLDKDIASSFSDLQDKLDNFLDRISA